MDKFNHWKSDEMCLTTPRRISLSGAKIRKHLLNPSLMHVQKKKGTSRSQEVEKHHHIICEFLLCEPCLWKGQDDDHVICKILHNVAICHKAPSSKALLVFHAVSYFITYLHCQEKSPVLVSTQTVFLKAMVRVTTNKSEVIIGCKWFGICQRKKNCLSK